MRGMRGKNKHFGAPPFSAAATIRRLNSFSNSISVSARCIYLSSAFDVANKVKINRLAAALHSTPFEGNIACTVPTTFPVAAGRVKHCNIAKRTFEVSRPTRAGRLAALFAPGDVQSFFSRVSYRTKFFELKITYGRVINDDNRTYVSSSLNFLGGAILTNYFVSIGEKRAFVRLARNDCDQIHLIDKLFHQALGEKSIFTNAFHKQNCRCVDARWPSERLTARYRPALISTLDRSAVDRNEQNAKKKRTERTKKNTAMMKDDLRFRYLKPKTVVG
ncbi:hypothetical protein PUN28_013287 [Cardiocondyla obscurior]|uniref:Uncharacterized protein n=1 Tax=Cardiocondyla obscurior TaxID=286306 RepID=A0AAW2F7R8_9HYME